MKTLLFYKNSTYSRYFSNYRRHSRTLTHVENFLRTEKIQFNKASRGASIDFKRFDLIITVGGDGTFLEAARHLKKQIILGINSDPAWSVGRFCQGDPDNFKELINKVMAGCAVIKKFHRLKLSFKGHAGGIDVLNDILICHKNPAAMSRYSLQIGTRKEEQRSSGVWIATAAGSSGGIYSAGGEILSQEAKDYQYKPRELYKARDKHYVFKGGILGFKKKITVTSWMREGVCCIDGSHYCLPFTFASKISITHSPIPLNIVF